MRLSPSFPGGGHSPGPGGRAVCTVKRFAERTVPGVRDGGPLDLGAGEVDPGAAGGTLDHWTTSVGFPTVASDLLLLVIVI